MRPKQNAAEKELRSLLSILTVIRILNCVSHAPMRSDDISTQFHSNGKALDSSSLNRTLLRLRHRGLLTTTKSTWSLTSKGRKALTLAISSLKNVTHLSSD